MPRRPRVARGLIHRTSEDLILGVTADLAGLLRPHPPSQRAADLTASLAATVTGVTAGSSPTRLIVLRGNSGSGKSSVAAEIRALYGRGIALVGQDNLRRVVLRERDVPGGADIGLIDTVTRYALCEFHVVVEGILRAAHYGPMLEALHRDHQSVARFYYLDVPGPPPVTRLRRRGSGSKPPAT